MSGALVMVHAAVLIIDNAIMADRMSRKKQAAVARVDRYPLIQRPTPTYWDAAKPLVVPLFYAVGTVALVVGCIAGLGFIIT